MELHVSNIRARRKALENGRQTATYEYVALGEVLELRARAERMEALLERARSPLDDHGWCKHHEADRADSSYTGSKLHADGDELWSLVSDIDAELGGESDGTE